MCYCYSMAFLTILIFLPITVSKPHNVRPMRKLKNDQSDILFPDVFDKQKEPRFIPEISGNRCRDGTTFCEHTDAYPYHVVERNLRNEEQFKYLFGIDDGDLVSDRLDEDEFVCASKSLLIFPKAAMNKRKQWKYIVNQGSGKEQGIRVEVCQREGSSCKLLSREVYKTSCKQKYAYRRLLSISYNGTLEPDSFLLPVACCCSYKPRIIWNPSG